MSNPQVGDIWLWNPDEDDGEPWTVLLTKKVSDGIFLGYALEDGWYGEWSFNGHFQNSWEFLA